MSVITQRGSLEAWFAGYCPNCSLAARDGHDAGPRGAWDFAIVAVGAVILLFTLFLALRFLLLPGEGSRAHVKLTILDDTVPARREA